MKRMIVFASLLALTQLGFAKEIDRKVLAEQCTAISQQLAKLTVVPHQAVKCDFKLFKASGLSYSAGHLINYKKDKFAKKALDSSIQNLSAAEDNNCQGMPIINLAKAHLLLIKESF